MIWNVAFDPVLGWPALIALAVAATVVTIVGAVVKARGTALRALLSLVLLLALADPRIEAEEREGLSDIALVVVDESPSQALEDRAAAVAAAREALTARLGNLDTLEVRVVTAGDTPEAAAPGSAGGVVDETRLFAALDRALADVPQGRLAGVWMITDGQVHDAPEGLTTGPLHVLLTGRRDEADRRLTVEDAPAFAVVDQPVDIAVRVDDLGPLPNTDTVPLTLRQNGEIVGTIAVPVGETVPVSVTLDRSGVTVVELSVPEAEGELSTRNNRTAVSLSGVRDRLRVLLVSGEPHPGERTWRNILKSDPAVDLVHFTILRPPEKQDGTPINELALIAFPVRELFEVRLPEFDLVIFDRYRRRGVLPLTYFENIADYVANGGAYLEASGPPFANSFSLYRTALGTVLPGAPTGSIVEEPFRPMVTDLGRRHPVTADLAESWGSVDGGPAAWGRWFRMIEVTSDGGQTVMTDEANRPLLLLDRVGDGRIAQLASDQIWLWARGFEGGGPQAELLRRLIHWLMKEPELEEEDLRATVADGALVIERQSLEAPTAPATVTLPDGTERTVTWDRIGPGLAEARVPIDAPGIHRVSHEGLTALGVAGRLAPPELADLRATDAVLGPLARQSGGGVFRVTDGLPSLREVDPGRAASGDGWAGVVRNDAYRVTAVTSVPLLPALLVLLAALGLAGTAWWREGR